MSAFSSIASSVFKCLKFTWDAPSRNFNQKMPVLDCQMWVGPCSREYGVPDAILAEKPSQNGPLPNVILYEFYRKPMARITPLLERSALPDRVKVSTVAQEVIRRFKNTSRNLPPSQIDSIIETYISDLKRGGFSQKWVENAVSAGVGGYQKMVKMKFWG